MESVDGDAERWRVLDGDAGVLESVGWGCGVLEKC